MSILRFKSESDLPASVQARLRGTPPDVLGVNEAGSIEATGLPVEADGSPAQTVGSRVDEDVAGEEGGHVNGFVLIPYPVSTNRYWRNFRGRMVVSKEAIAYKVRVADIFRLVGQQTHTGPVSVLMFVHPKTTKKGVASKVRADLDNLLKVVFDGLNGVAWVDDSQVVKLQAEFAAPIEGGGVSISVEAA